MLPPDTTLLRRALGRYATGVCVVTAMDGGLDHAMTANSFTSVSLDPMLVLVCVERDARFHDAIIAGGQWGISVLDGTAEPVARWLATRGRPLQGQLSQVPHHRGPATGVALMDDALAWLECRTDSVTVAGDHSIVVGEVLNAGLREGRDGSGETPAALVYYRSSYGQLA